MGHCQQQQTGARIFLHFLLSSLPLPTSMDEAMDEALASALDKVLILSGGDPGKGTYIFLSTSTLMN